MLSPLSPDAQQYLDRQDVDSFIMEWNVPAAHRFAFDELVRKGYLIPHTKTVTSADGKHQGEQRGYIFAQELQDKLSETMRFGF